jgi:hypothetical protein
VVCSKWFTKKCVNKWIIYNGYWHCLINSLSIFLREVTCAYQFKT